MKTVYIKPITEITQVGTYSLLQSVSGGGFKNGGTDPGDGTIIPQ